MRYPRITFAGLFATAGVVASVSVAGQTASSPGAKTPAVNGIVRTAWGAPNLQGVWSTSTVTPLQRPDGVGELLTEEEIAETERRAVVRATDEARGQDRQADVRGAYNDFWREGGIRVADSRTSLIFDPKDGRLPALTPRGQELR